MDQQGQTGPTGPGGRRLHIAHRRSPSEMTPLMMEQLALAQQIEMLQQQQQQIAATHQQYVNLGMIQPQQQLPNQTYAQVQGHLSPPNNAFAFQQQQQFNPQQMAMQMGQSPQNHRRNQSAMPNVGMGPPPAPSAGSGTAFNDFSFSGRKAENVNPRGRGGGNAGGGHARRHSLALPEAKKAAELAEQKRKNSAFQFPDPTASSSSPAPANRSLSPSAAENQAQSQDHRAQQQQQGGGNRGAHGRSQSMAVGRGGRGGPVGFQFPQPGQESQGQSDFQRRGSQGHGRTQSRNFEGNWRQQQQPQHDQQAMGNFQMNQHAGAQPFQPGHRNRASISSHQSVGSLNAFQFPPQPQILQLPQGQVLVQPGMFQGQQLNPLQLAQIQAYQSAGLQPPIPGMQGQGQMTMQQQQQQRKTLFTPYLPQATLPALLGDGQLVAGVLRVNKKNRSDAYVTTSDLDADIFICGSKDRNRALEGDMVAVELLDVDEVWSQKREKEEKKKRKDLGDPRSGGITAVNDATTQPESSAIEGGIRRRGSLKQRPTQKKNDDVEVEGQSLLLVEEDEINDEQKPLYAGHIVAVVERVAGQMFSGSLGLLRPSSQATKERQEAERGGRQQENRQPDRPKIVWFKPTDKRVPLIAIPTEQAPKDFVDRHQDYANKIFVACIKRWPITSLHPFGTLVEQLGDAGDLKVETDALLRDNNFGPDEFSDAVMRNVGFDNWSVAQDGEAGLKNRRDFRNVQTFSIDPNGSGELDDAIHFRTLDSGLVEIAIHVTDIAHFVKHQSLVDREAKKRGTGVYLVNRTVNMLPPKLASDVCCLKPGEERYTVSVVFSVNPETGAVNDSDTWVGKSVIKSSGRLTYGDVDSAISGSDDIKAGSDIAKQIRALNAVAQKLRSARFGARSSEVPSLRLIYQLDDENVPVEQNIFNTSPAHEMIEELCHRANAFVAQKLAAGLPEKALLRRQAPPNPRRLATFAERMTNIGYEVDTSSSGALQTTLFNLQDSDIRKGMETLLIKSMNRAKYFLPGKVPQDQWQHYVLNSPLYTHFTNPTRRYADIIVHRQLEHVLAGTEYTEDLENLHKTADACNTKKDSAHAAQEQSVHIESCRVMDKKSRELGGDLISEGIVLCVYESAFDVLIPEYGFEKRVHCDQLPLKKAEFDKKKRLLELYWEKGVPSSAYVPEDEQPKAGRGTSGGPYQPKGGRQDNTRRQPETGTMAANATDALFDDDGESVSDVNEHMAGVSLNQDRNTQSLPPSPTHNGMSSAPQRAKSDSKALHKTTPESRISNKEKYLKLFKLREEGGEYIQDVTEMARVPIILKTDMTKSPPCLTIRSVNPYAL